MKKERVETLTDIELCERIIAGNKEAETYVYNKHKKKVKTIIFSWLDRYRKKSEVDDYVQDVWIEVYKSIKSNGYKGDKKGLIKYIYGILKHVMKSKLIKDMIQKNRFEKYEKIVKENLDDYKSKIVEKGDDQSLRIIKKYNSLEEKYRITLELIYYQGLSTAEIAEELGIDVATVRWRKSEALKKLRKKLKKKDRG